MWGENPAPTSEWDVHQSRLWQLSFLHPSWLCWVSHSLSLCLAQINQALAVQHPCSVASLERTDLCVGTVRSKLQLAPNFQKYFRGCFLLVLNVGFLSPVVAACSLPVFPLKGVSAVTCSGALEFECVRCTFLCGVMHSQGPQELLSNVFLFPHSSYEDLDALDGGDDGMRVIKTILALAPSLLKVSG